MNKPFIPIVVFLLIFPLISSAAPPVVSNVRASQRGGTGFVDIYYDVVDPDGGPLNVSVWASFNGGKTYDFWTGTFGGSGFGSGVSPGSNRHIEWNAGNDLHPVLWSKVKVKVIASDSETAPPPSMGYVPPGPFTMGDNFAIGGTAERPTHNVNVSGFYLEKFEVTKALWDSVRSWATSHSYQFDNAGSGVSSNHPVHTVSWFDVVKWCNARSEMEGRTALYYTDAAQTNVYRQGQLNLSASAVRWTANGYRLPTEAEWEKAARGGLPGHYYPWPSNIGAYTDNIDGSKANYSGSGDPFEGNSVKTTPVGYYADNANGYGLYDMAGNVYEWCWDWYDGSWYSNAGATLADSRGPSTGADRVCRGGGWSGSVSRLRCADRSAPTGISSSLGFRCVRGQ